MNFDALMQNRRAVHHFLRGQKVPIETYKQILEIVRWTPSGYNAQPWKFLLIQDDQQLQDIQALSFHQKQITQSGNVVMVFGDTNFMQNEQQRILSEWSEVMTDQQLQSLKSTLQKERPMTQKEKMTLRAVSMAAMNFLLAAESLGWNTCPMMGFQQKKVKQYLGVPEHYICGLMIAMGKADNAKENKKIHRKNILDIQL